MLKLPRDVPGMSELEEMCRQARRVVAFCEAIGVNPPDDHPLLEDSLEGVTGARELRMLEQLGDEDYPYIWDR